MKRFLCIFLSALITISPLVKSMDQAIIEEGPITTLTNDEHIVFIFSLIDPFSALSTLKNLLAYTSTCKKFQIILHDKAGITRWLIDFMIKNNLDFDHSYLEHLHNLLHKPELSSYQENLKKAYHLFPLFQECSENKSWDAALTYLSSIQEKDSYQAVNCSIVSSEEDKALRRQATPLSAAITLEAPKKVIKMLLKLKANVNLIIAGPSELAIALILIKKNDDSPTNKNLLAIAELLLNSGANVNYQWNYLEEQVLEFPKRERSISIKRRLTPLIVTTSTQNEKAVRMLLNKGAQAGLSDALIETAFDSTGVKEGEMAALDLFRILLQSPGNCSLPASRPDFKSLPPLFALILLAEENTSKITPFLKELLWKEDTQLFLEGVSATAFVERNSIKTNSEIRALLHFHQENALKPTWVECKKAKVLIKQREASFAENQVKLKKAFLKEQLFTKETNFAAEDTLLKAIDSLEREMLQHALQNGAQADRVLDQQVPSYGHVNSTLHHIVSSLTEDKEFFFFSKELTNLLLSTNLEISSIIKLLIEAGAPRERKNGEGKTAAQKAREMGSLLLLILLLR